MADYEDKETLRDNFPSNSKTKKIEKSAETPKVEKVITGSVKKQKRSFGKKMAETFLEDDSKSVGSYMVHDVLIPAGKSMICDIVGWGGFAEMMLFGGIGNKRGGSSIRREGNRSVTNYSASYNQGMVRDSRDRSAGREISKLGRARHDFDEVILETRGEAEDVLAHLFDLTTDYGQATVADLYDLVGITSNFTDNKFGWTDLRGASVARVRGGYLINLPRTQALD